MAEKHPKNREYINMIILVHNNVHLNENPTRRLMTVERFSINMQHPGTIPTGILEDRYDNSRCQLAKKSKIIETPEC